MLSAITAAAAPRSVLTVIAASAAFTYRVSSSTTSNPALARTACNHQAQRARYIRTARFAGHRVPCDRRTAAHDAIDPFAFRLVD